MNLDIIEVAAEYREVQQKIKLLEEHLEVLKAAMVAEMDAQQVEKLQAGQFEIRYSLYDTSRLDVKALKADMPDVAERYTISKTTTRFQVA